MKYKVLLTDLIGTVYDEFGSCPGVPRTLKKLKEKGVKVVAVSAGLQGLKESKLKNLGLLDYFYAVEASSKYGLNKSEVDMYAVVAENLAFSKEDCLVVGNNERSDIALPNASGFVTVKAAYGWEKVLPTIARHKITDYSELLKFFKRE